MLTATPLRTIPIPAGESLLVELGAMEAYSETMTMNTGVHTSVYSAALRKLFGGEDFFVNKFSASPNKAGWIALEEATPGQLSQYTLKPGEKIVMKKGAFVACDANVTVSASITGFHGHLSKVGFVVLEATTTNNKPGRIFFGSGEGVVKILEVTEQTGSVVVDNNNIIAYTSGLSLSTTAPGGPFSWYYGKEGIATRFTGKGSIYIGSPKPASDLAAKNAEASALRAELAAQRILLTQNRSQPVF